MASALDVYAPCPCGSGKKVKFCCGNALSEMDRVSRLHEKHQPQQALDALQKISQQYPEAPIVPITRAQLLMEQQRFDEAAALMRDFTKQHNEIGHGHALLAMAYFLDVGFHEAKPEIHRAFQVCTQSSPEVLSSLAMHIADDLLESNPMAAREHLGLALRLAKDKEDRSALFQQLMKLDGSPQIPYPLRSTHHLEKIDPPEGHEKDLKNANRMSMHGCWEIAGKLYQKVSDALPNHWGLWKNIGLCRIWDDNLTGAVEALRKACELATDFESAVECETMAQLLEINDVEDKTPVKVTRLKLKSTSKVLSVLDEIPRCLRLPPQEEQVQGIDVVGRYLFLEFAPATEDSTSGERDPVIQAEVAVYDVDAGEIKHGTISISSIDGSARDAAVQIIQDALGEEVIPFEPHEYAHNHDHDGDECSHDHDCNEPLVRHEITIREALTEIVPMQVKHYFGKRPDSARRRAWRKQHAHDFLQNHWYQLPLKRLGGKSPKEAAADPSLKVKLCAAIYALDAIAHVATNNISLNVVRQELGIEPEAPLTANDETIDTLSVMQSHRLPLQELSSDQLSHVMQRSLLVRHVPFTFAVMSEISKRGLEHLKGLTVEQFARMFANVARELGERDLALEWVVRGRAEGEQGEDFGQKVEWAMLEFELRLENPQDPALPPLVDRLWNYFGVKLPQLRTALEPALREFGLPVPGETKSGLVLPESMTVGANATAETPKLWLPGT